MSGYQVMIEPGPFEEAGNLYLIWWTNQQDCVMIKALAVEARGLTAGFSEDDGVPGWPSYLADQYSGRYGRSGRGRLWIAAEVGAPEGLSPWPNTALGRHLALYHAGIVIHADDLHHVINLPGIVTDMRLNLVQVRR